MKHATTSGKLENMKQLRMMNFFVILFECKDSGPNVPPELGEMWK
jgi:hypothetical protein